MDALQRIDLRLRGLATDLLGSTQGDRGRANSTKMFSLLNKHRIDQYSPIHQVMDRERLGATFLHETKSGKTLLTNIKKLALSVMNEFMPNGIYTDEYKRDLDLLRACEEPISGDIYRAYHSVIKKNGYMRRLVVNDVVRFEYMYPLSPECEELALRLFWLLYVKVSQIINIYYQ